MPISGRITRDCPILKRSLHSTKGAEVRPDFDWDKEPLPQTGFRDVVVADELTFQLWNHLHTFAFLWRATPFPAPAAWPGTAPPDVIPDGTVPFCARVGSRRMTMVGGCASCNHKP